MLSNAARSSVREVKMARSVRCRVGHGAERCVIASAIRDGRASVGRRECSDPAMRENASTHPWLPDNALAREAGPCEPGTAAVTLAPLTLLLPGENAARMVPASGTSSMRRNGSILWICRGALACD